MDAFPLFQDRHRFVPRRGQQGARGVSGGATQDFLCFSVALMPDRRSLVIFLHGKAHGVFAMRLRCTLAPQYTHFCSTIERSYILIIHAGMLLLLLSCFGSVFSSSPWQPWAPMAVTQAEVRWTESAVVFLRPPLLLISRTFLRQQNYT